MEPLLNILEYKLVGLSFEPTGDFRPGVPHSGEIMTTLEVHRGEEPNRFSIVMTCDLRASGPEHNSPYHVTMTVTGEFWSRLALSADAPIPALVVNNGMTILYGAMRGVVGQLTANGINGQFTLPSLTFDELLVRAASEPDSHVGWDSFLEQSKKISEARSEELKGAGDNPMPASKE